jgi:hypothetical protein
MRLAFATLALSLGACTATRLPTDPRDTVLDGMVGTWENRAQFSAAPAELKVPPSVDGEWLDLQHATFARVDAPALGTHVLYLEWRSNGPDGPISRQRLWSFHTDPAGELRMDFYAFVDGKPYAGRGGETGAFGTLARDALRGYGPSCALRFELQARGFVGEISAEECTITAASGRRMGINARVALTADGTLEYRESGRLDDGRYAFRVPPTEPYRFQRLR